MKLYSIIIFAFVGVLSENSSYGMHLEFIPSNSLHVCVDECATVILYQSEKLPNRTSVIRLISKYEDIASVTPTSIQVNGSVNEQVEICGIQGGYTVIVARGPKLDNKTLPAFLPVTVSKIRVLKLISDVTGWIYFISWSISYYPQIYTNYARKSVVGLNFDFATLNIIGFMLYSLYNCAMYFSPSIQRQYFRSHPKGMNPVMLNDVIFSLHAFFATSIIIYHCLVYERGTQKVSWVAKFIIILYVIIVVTSATLAYMGTLPWIEFILYCSYIKLSVTMIKYIPQAVMNYSRKSTVGWSIENVLLDFIGGTFSMMQMTINSYNYDDWDSIFGDPTKFGLGLFSVMFDVFFMYQHYILYRIPYEEQVDEITVSPETPESETLESKTTVNESDNQSSSDRLAVGHF